MDFLVIITCFGFLVVANIFMMLKEIQGKQIFLVLNLLTIVGYLIFIIQFWNEDKGNLVFIILNICALFYMGSHYFINEKDSSKKNIISRNLDKIALVVFIFLIIDYFQ